MFVLDFEVDLILKPLCEVENEVVDLGLRLAVVFSMMRIDDADVGKTTILLDFG